MRQIRDGISAEVADMSYDELAQWLRAHQYSDPFLQKLAEKKVLEAEHRGKDVEAKSAQQADRAVKAPPPGYFVGLLPASIWSRVHDPDHRQ